jgi:molybdopterin adenylyltransferase
MTVLARRYRQKGGGGDYLERRGSLREPTDTSGPAVCALLQTQGWKVVYQKILPDDFESIRQELIHCADRLDVCLVVTTGGTGFSKRDIAKEG